ncbi:MAG: DUF1573 domain-containing protein [Planctomycetota bacterium]|jgi:hypothetical protein|nr:DUF1573 domain-containing protein [Planctomycetota bacterium]
MHRLCLAILAGLALACPASASSWADGLFDDLNKDFGSVPRGPVLQHNFVIKNTTAQTVTFGAVRVSCGCTSTQLMKTVLKPGEQTTLNTRMDTSRFRGSKTVTIYVQISRPESQEVRLWVKANAREDVAITPESIDLGTIRSGETRTAKAQIHFYGGQGLELSEPQASSGYLEPSIKQLPGSEQEKIYEVSVVVRPDLPAGRWYADIWVETNLSQMPKLRIPLNVEVESELVVSPGEASMGEWKEGQDVERKIIIRSGKPFKIVRFENESDTLHARASSPDAKSVHVVTVSAKGTKPGDVDTMLKVHTDLPENGVVTVPVRGKVVSR